MRLPTQQEYGKLAIAVLVLLALAIFFKFELYRHLNLQSLKGYQIMLADMYARHPFVTMTGYLALYISVAAVSLPFIIVMSIAGGAIFGLVPGVIAASFANAIGGTLSFLAARFLFRDDVQRRFAGSLKTINREVERDGAFYLLTLRLVPAFPYFLINILMALTPIKTRLFYIVTQAAMLPSTIIYVNAGTQLAAIESADDIFSFGLIASFALLGLSPWIAKGLAAAVRLMLKSNRYPKQ